MRDIALVTVARSDWGIYRPVLRELAMTPGLSPRILASGMHLAERFGNTLRLVEEDAAAFGVSVEPVPMDIDSDAPVDVASAMGMGLRSFAQSFAARRPDVVLVLGDRFEMFAAVAAAVPFVLPVFHIHGGERTAGAIDDALRHAMTKMSHVHFVSTRDYSRRVRQLGEDAWRIILSGAPALDELGRLEQLSLPDLGAKLSFDLGREYLVVAYHPTTLEPGEARTQGDELLAALKDIGLPVIFMMPNADPGGSVIRTAIKNVCRDRDDWVWVENLNFPSYAALLRSALALVGNSSSGIIEAPFFQLPVVNIGRRQEGRVRAGNVIDVGQNAGDISRGIQLAQNADWRKMHLIGRNPYDAGGASRIIARTIAEIPLDSRLSNKGFVDVPVPRERRSVDEFSVVAGSTLREVVRCIDLNRTGMAVVIDKNEALVDVVTDGDIRRALLAGAGLDDSVGLLAGRRPGGVPPRVGQLGESEAEWVERMRGAKVRQLPIVDDGRVVDMVLLDELGE